MVFVDRLRATPFGRKPSSRTASAIRSRVPVATGRLPERACETVVALTRLTKKQIGEMIRGATGKADVPPAVVEQVAERTDGVPLFVEEFARVLVEGGSWAAGSIPATLQDLLLARLDRMASNKDVIQLGAAIGRTF